MRLITANLRAGRISGEDSLLLRRPDKYFAHQREAWQETAELWAAQDPDVICLQEVDFRQPRSGFRDLTGFFRQALSQLSGTHWQARFLAFYAGQTALGLRLPVVLPRGQNTGLLRPFLGCDPWLGGFGVAILTKHPVRRWLAARLGASAPQFGGHLWKPRTWSFYPGQTRNLLATQIELPEQSVLLGTAHLELISDTARYQLRRAWNGLADLANLQAACRVSPHIASPDLLREGTGWNTRRKLVSQTGGKGAQPTRILLVGDFNLGTAATGQILPNTKILACPSFPATDPVFSLDQIIGESNLLSDGVESLPMPISDHRALVAQLDWPKD